MSNEAKIGLGIVLGALLVSVVLIGKTVSKKDPAVPGGSAVAAASAEPVSSSTSLSGTRDSTSLSSSLPSSSSTPGTFGVDGGSMDKLVSSGTPEAPAPVTALPLTPAPAVTAPPTAELPKTSVREDLGLEPWTGKTHVVAKKGETLPELSRKYYGSSRKTELIAKANPGVDFKKPLAVGTKLAIPEAPAKAIQPAAVTTPTNKVATEVPAAVPSGRIHRVQPGETLSILADRYLGKASLYPEILAANPGLTKDSTLKVGQKIVIPAASGK